VKTAELQVAWQVDQKVEDCREDVDDGCSGNKPYSLVLDAFRIEAVANRDAGLHDGQNEEVACQHPDSPFLLVAVPLDFVDLSQPVYYLHLII